MNHFMSRRDTVGDTSFETQVNIEAFGIWCFLIHSGSRMLSGAEGHANWGTGHSMKQDLHAPFVSKTKTLGNLEFWTFFCLIHIHILTEIVKAGPMTDEIFCVFFVVKSPGGIGYRHRDEHRSFRRFSMQGWDRMKVLIGSDHKIMGIFRVPPPPLQC